MRGTGSPEKNIEDSFRFRISAVEEAYGDTIVMSVYQCRKILLLKI